MFTANDDASDKMLSMKKCLKTLKVMNWRKQFREWHRRLAGIMVLPLIITAVTGVSYRLSKDWFGFTRDQAHFLMVIHEGEYLGDQLKGVYVLLNGLGVLFLLTTGATMLFSNVMKSGLFSSRQQPKEESKS